MKTTLIAAVTLALSAGMSLAAVVSPDTPLPDYEEHISQDCDASAIAHIDCIGMVVDSGLNPAPNDSEDALNDNTFFGMNTWEQVDKYDSDLNMNENGILDMTGAGSTSGTYSFSGMAGYVYTLVVKASPGFSAYLLGGTSASMATWDTLGLISNGGRTPGISHLSLYRAPAEVPVPASLPLLAFGLGAFAFIRRRV